LVSLTDVSIRA
jgi:hypothetical protein